MFNFAGASSTRSVLRGNCTPQSHLGYRLDTYPAGSVYQMGKINSYDRQIIGEIKDHQPEGDFCAVDERVEIYMYMNCW